MASRMGWAYEEPPTQAAPRIVKQPDPLLRYALDGKTAEFRVFLADV
jgi:hypothetical protein